MYVILKIINKEVYTMVKKNNLWYKVTQAKHFYLITGKKVFKAEKEKAYAEYKKAGGKRKLK